MQTDLYTKTGTKATKKATLDKAVFEAKVNKPLLDQAVFVYLSNQRQSNAHSKTRGEVSGGGKKPWRQKGTGRARHGSSRSPIWTGGGVTFGPRNEMNFKKKLSKKMRKAAMRSAFSLKAQDKNVVVFEDFDLKETGLAKSLVEVLNKAKIEGKLLIVQGEKNEQLINAASNLKKVRVIMAGELNVYELLNNDVVLLLDNSLEAISSNWGEEAKEAIEIVEKAETPKTEPKAKTTTKKTK